MMQAELSNIVTFNPSTIHDQTTLGELLDVSDTVDFHHWPVVDDRRRLVGMLSSPDLVRILQAASLASLTLSHECREQKLAAVRQQSVGEVVSRRVLSVQQHQPPSEALWTMLEHSTQALPVLADDHLSAIATTTDFLREFSYGESPLASAPVSHFVQPTCEPVDCDATLDEAAMAMRIAQTDVIPVVRGDLPLGIVSRRDLQLLKLRQTLADVFAAGTRADKPTCILALAAAAPTIRPGERLAMAAGRMIEHRRQVIAVVNRAGRLLGAVTEEVVLRAMLDEMRG